MIGDENLVYLVRIDVAPIRRHTAPMIGDENFTPLSLIYISLIDDTLPR